MGLNTDGNTQRGPHALQRRRDPSTVVSTKDPRQVQQGIQVPQTGPRCVRERDSGCAKGIGESFRYG